MAIWDAIKELEGLQRKAAKGEEICDSDTFIVRAALKEKGWEDLFCEEAISRGYKEARGEEVTSIPLWYAEEAAERLERRYAVDNEVLISPEIPGLETSEEEPEVPGRVFNLLGDLGTEESKEQEEVCEEGPEINEYVRYLNGITMMRTGNPQWEDFLWTYMKKHGLKPSDMEGLVGPRPWMNDPLWYNPDEEEISAPPFPGSEDDTNLAEFRKIFGPIKEKEEIMEQLMEDKQRPPTLAEYAMAKKAMEQDPSDTRRRVLVGEEVGWLCEDCSTVWNLDELRCRICTKAEPPTVEHRGWGDTKLLIGTDVLREHMAKHLEKKKDDKDLAIDAMHKALGISVEYPEGVQVISIKGAGDEEDEHVQCDHCGGNDYLECDCCLECESEECVCCDNCARFPCQCDTEECPICHNHIAIGTACPHGCDSDITELQKLYEDVKDSEDLAFGEKVKFMSLLKEKMGLASDVADPNDPVATAEYLDDPETMEEE